MAANAFAAYGFYAQTIGLQNVMQTLLRGGVDKECICMMLPAEHPLAAVVRQASADAVEAPANGEAAGLIRWFSEFGAVLIPKFGFFIRSQEFMRTLMAGDTPSGGTLAALGFQDDQVKRFTNQPGDPGVLLYLSCPERTSTGWALELLRGTGAQEAGLLSGDTTLRNAA
jgi:hypothetical protein